MGNKRRYKLFEIRKVDSDRWHIGAFFSVDYDQFYLMIALVKWDIYIGKHRVWDDLW